MGKYVPEYTRKFLKPIASKDGTYRFPIFWCSLHYTGFQYYLINLYEAVNLKLPEGKQGSLLYNMSFCSWQLPLPALFNIIATNSPAIITLCSPITLCLYIYLSVSPFVGFTQANESATVSYIHVPYWHRLFETVADFTYPFSITSYPRHAVAQLVEALRYKPEGRGFNSQWCHWNFSLT